MRRLNKNMEQEAIVVRIITLVTLVYLPATFVSTLFSTDIVKYQENGYPDGKYSQVAMNRWLEVTIPLTILTLFAAWWAYGWATKRAARAIGDTMGGCDEGSVGVKGGGEVEGAAAQALPYRGNRIVAWLHAPTADRVRRSAKWSLQNVENGDAGPFP